MKAKPKARSTQATGSIRIIGGRWRGRKLPVLAADGLRPTTDRVKETLFNWLQFELQDAHVLDLFAGTGSLGLEALSRGAAVVTFAETQRPACQQLASNLAMLEASGQIDSQGAEHCLQQLPAHSIDIAFIDPPFGKDWLQRIIAPMETRQLVADGGWVYVESGVNDPFVSWPSAWHLHREKRAGQVHSRLFRVRRENAQAITD
ncbi:16S rRNA (guanine(966)-N(2))-methyltransferase RsmD [Aliidiomarina soli]|uniref:Ribosomal RNA small subunit methyltransferase D n=1 Tax=Aliidiomarina soli TaxID=1928574 RepID=A0A432WJF4_9GAMM|nr:16S rRNA (guanine(966)-N(2))-methyltransferase RsmD [Aliidiomarina soli]RUO33888.1 16S rRNA (guanine(966)-N(2))-methyltransferase RsmD [Aliidiomarina soli]